MVPIRRLLPRTHIVGLARVVAVAVLVAVLILTDMRRRRRRSSNMLAILLTFPRTIHPLWVPLRGIALSTFAAVRSTVGFTAVARITATRAGIVRVLLRLLVLVALLIVLCDVLDIVLGLVLSLMRLLVTVRLVRCCGTRLHALMALVNVVDIVGSFALPLITVNCLCVVLCVVLYFARRSGMLRLFITPRGRLVRPVVAFTDVVTERLVTRRRRQNVLVALRDHAIAAVAAARALAALADMNQRRMACFV
jgi:hypothetical protein